VGLPRPVRGYGRRGALGVARVFPMGTPLPDSVAAFKEPA